MLAGAGDKAFCSGADLGSMHRGTPAGESAGSRTPEGRAAHQHEARGELAGLFEQTLGARQADDRAGPGVGDGGGLRPGARLRSGGGFATGAVRGAGGERRALAIHDHRPDGQVDAPEEGPRADAHRPGGRCGGGRTDRVRHEGGRPRAAGQRGRRAGGDPGAEAAGDR